MAQWISDKWCFTVNAPAKADKKNALEFLDPICEGLKKIPCRSCAFQIEIGETGTYHIQGVICFERKYLFKQVKELIHPTAHIEKCRDLIASVKYCTKEDTRFGNQFIKMPENKVIDEVREWEKFLANNPGCWGCNDKWPYCPTCIDCRDRERLTHSVPDADLIDWVEGEDNILPQ